MANTNAGPEPYVMDPDRLAEALAKSVHTGDFVNFRFLFSPFSPGRSTAPEHFDIPKYDYLAVSAEERNAAGFVEALELVKRADTWRHVENELTAARPAQMPSELVVALADNAVRLGKYSNAAQAYELLRIRAKMKSAFFDAADRALDASDVEKAVSGYLVATGLSYDYAAFPEPLPQVPDYQTRALMLHAEYPQNPESGVGMLDGEAFMSTALSYLLYDGEGAARLAERSYDVRLAFLKELIRQCDPNWSEFAERFHESMQMVREWGEKLIRKSDDDGDGALALEIREQQSDDPRTISAHLLGRTIEDGEWWQYMKELAYEHPASILFVARQMVGEHEIVIPRVRSVSPVVEALALLRDPALQGGNAH